MRNDFYYANAETCSTGLMICGACNKSIDSGEYRYRDAGDRYVCHHRSCSEDDPNWSKRDRAYATKKAQWKAMERDFSVLQEKHGEILETHLLDLYWHSHH